MRNRSKQLFTAIGLAKGDSGAAVTQLQDHLARFGYLAAREGDPYARLRAGARERSATRAQFDDATVAALRRYQTYFKLPVTGTLDAATAGQLSRPRCGFPDIPVPRMAPGADGSPAGFVAQGNKWTGSPLTYHVDNYTGDLSQQQVDDAVAAAFRLWADQTPLTFEVSAADPDIHIRFVTGDHGDGSPFDGVGGILAHAFYPPPNGGDIAGDAHFDDAETWTVGLPPTGTDLVSVCAHEFGHSLGLAHSPDSSALMYPYYSGAHRYLAADDINGIQSVYGKLIHPVPGWFGAEDQGASVAVADINGNGRPDLIVFHVDNPAGENHGYYRIGCDLNADGEVANGWTDLKPVPGWFGAEDQGAGIAAGDISRDGRPDLVVFHVDNPAGENHGYYRVGFNLDTGGTVTGGWSPVMPVPGWFGAEDQGASVALADISGNGLLDLVVFHLDNPEGDNHGYYRIGYDLDKNGQVTGGWSEVKAVPGWFGWEDQGAGIALADVTRNGRPDLIVFHLDNPAGENHGYYRIGYDLDTGGTVTGGWGTIKPVAGWFGAEDQGAGIAVTDIDSDGHPDLIVFHVDNPAGENHGYYRVVKNIS